MNRIKTNLVLLLIAVSIGLTFVSCSDEEEHRTLIRGKIVADLWPCIGNELIISVLNDKNIGSYDDGYGDSVFFLWQDTLFYYNNVIAMPKQFDLDGNNRYSLNGKKLPELKVGDIITFEYEEATDDDANLFKHNSLCLAIYGPPSNVKRIKIKKIVKYEKGE
ncbi:MAG: hypothetical protein IJ180_07885 [Bacteroidales bacterium]|nr:hypothetical protein [Bacteroidales bacterium]